MNALAPKVLFAACVALTIGAATPTQPAVSLAPGGRVWLDGDSTLHRYHLDAKTFTAAFTVSSTEGDVASLVRGEKVTGFTVTIPVAKLTSGEDGLDKNLRKVLDADKHPDITFAMHGYQVKPTKDPKASFGLLLHGTLTVAGTSKPADVVAQAFTAGTSLRVTGQVPLTMSTFEVKAPVLFLGTLKTSDAVSVGFDLTLSPAR